MKDRSIGFDIFFQARARGQHHVALTENHQRYERHIEPLHHAGILPLYHFDLYRIDDMVQILDLGCEDYWGGGGVAVIEWGEKAADLLPEEHFRVEFQFVDEFIRKIAFRGSGSRFSSLIENLMAIVPAPK